MQLKKSRAIRNKLALASSALLLAMPAQSPLAAAKVINDDSVDISQLYYSEEGRVSVKKTQALITKKFGEDNKFKLNAIYDTMSGASPNGRIYSVIGGGDGNITYTTASGTSNTVASNSGSGSIEAWKTSFKDTRTAFNAEWEHKFLPVLSSIIGGGISNENDYESKTFSGKLLLDTNQRRTTLTAGMSISLDTVKPFGGVPESTGTIICHENAFFRPNWLDCDTPKVQYKPADKVINDYLVGITQVWNKRTLMQLNFAFSQEDGYLNDPYKQVSIVNSLFDGGEIAVLHENRPNTRNTRSLYYKVVHVPKNNIAMHVSYRFYWDDWGVLADTLDSRIRINMTPGIYLQAHARLHWQGAADFFQPSVGADPDSKYFAERKPDFISADSRLGELATVTAGLKLGIKINKDSNISARVEQMTQKYDNRLLPMMKVWITQIILSFKF